MLTLLGSGGWVPSDTRETCCAFTRDGDQALLIDAGTGLRRLLTDPSLLDGVTHLDVVLTHFHLDHTCGLAYAGGLPVERIDLHGPGAALYGTPTATCAGLVFADPIQGQRLEDVVAAVHETPVGAYEVGPWRLTTRRQDRHLHPTMGLRLGDDVAYVTDTAPDPGTVGFAEGVRVLCHESWGGPGEDVGDSHTTSDEAAGIARDAGVEQLVLIHVHPTRDVAALQAGAPDATVGSDGLAV